MGERKAKDRGKEANHRRRKLNYREQRRVDERRVSGGWATQGIKEGT